KKQVPVFVKQEYGGDVRQVPELVGKTSGLVPLVGLKRSRSAEALKTEALKLNILPAKDQAGQIKSLTEDADYARELLAVAAGLARDHNQPFNYNGASLLGRIALHVREPEAGRTFFRLCLDQAAPVKDQDKLRQGFSGLLSVIDLQYDLQKYADSVR